MKFILPFPPSVNSYWRSPNKGTAKGKLLVSEAGRKFKHAVRAAIIEQLKAVPKPSASPAEVVLSCIRLITAAAIWTTTIRRFSTHLHTPVSGRMTARLRE